jgi:hypothetical protein
VGRVREKPALLIDVNLLEGGIRDSGGCGGGGWLLRVKRVESYDSEGRHCGEKKERGEDSRRPHGQQSNIESLPIVASDGTISGLHDWRLSIDFRQAKET